MKKKTFPITQRQISNDIGRTIHTPIQVSNVQKMHIKKNLFLEKLSPLFAELPWEHYDARRLRVDFLKSKFPKEEEKIQKHFTDYFTGKIEIDVFEKWISQLNKNDLVEFEKIQPWRRRSVAQFVVDKKNNKHYIKREFVSPFVQGMESEDYHSLPRVYEEAPDHHVENHMFLTILIRVYQMVQELRPNSVVTIITHFISDKATEVATSDNSPEGAYEDDIDYFISALVVNRINVKGGESHIIEKLSDASKEIIFRHTLQPGEFVFQANTVEESIDGNDLRHEVTPIYIDKVSQGEGWRDIIGFDVMVRDKI